MDALSPLEALFVHENGTPLPLEGELARVFAPLSLEARADRPYVIGNIVTTLDGVVALNVDGSLGGGAISGFNQQDLALLGLLRAAADVVIIGAGTMRVETHSLLTHEAVLPELQADYQRVRRSLGKSTLPWNVIITARGKLNLAVPAFQDERVPVLVITTSGGLAELQKQPWPSSLQVIAAQADGPLKAQAILTTIASVCQGSLWLLEGGPSLLGTFLEEEVLDELFLTLAPQVAGRDGELERPGLVSGKLFAPQRPRWGELAAVRRGGDHLFLRYLLKNVPRPAVEP